MQSTARITCSVLVLLWTHVNIDEARAQDCPYPDSVAVADTLDPRGYSPIHVGDFWEYTIFDGAFPDSPERVDIVADTTIGGSRFYRRQWTRFENQGLRIVGIRSRRSSFVEVTPNGALVISDGVNLDTLDMLLDRPFNSCHETELYGPNTVVSGGYGGVFRVEEHGMPVSYATGAIKQVGILIGGVTDYAHGYGDIGGWGDPSVVSELVHGRVNGKQFGTPLTSVFDFDIRYEPQLSSDADTVFFTGRGPAEDYVVVRNEGIAELSIDSLRFSNVPHGWFLRLVQSDTTHSVWYAFGVLDSPNVFPDVTLAAGETLRIEFVAYDHCLVCSGKGGIEGTVGDTLSIFTNDPEGGPVQIYIDFSRYVGTETVAHHGIPLAVRAYPNPASSYSMLAVDAPYAGTYEAGLYDLLGRRIREGRVRLRMGRDQRVPVPWSCSHLPSGVYIIRVADGRWTTSVPLTIFK